MILAPPYRVPARSDSSSPGANVFRIVKENEKILNLRVKKVKKDRLDVIFGGKRYAIYKKIES